MRGESGGLGMKTFLGKPILVRKLGKGVKTKLSIHLVITTSGKTNRQREEKRLAMMGNFYMQVI